MAMIRSLRLRRPKLLGRYGSQQRAAPGTGPLGVGFVPGVPLGPRWRIYRDPLHANIIWGVAATLGVVFIVFIWEFAGRVLRGRGER